MVWGGGGFNTFWNMISYLLPGCNSYRNLPLFRGYNKNWLEAATREKRYCPYYSVAGDELVWRERRASAISGALSSLISLCAIWPLPLCPLPRLSQAPGRHLLYIYRFFIPPSPPLCLSRWSRLNFESGGYKLSLRHVVYGLQSFFGFFINFIAPKTAVPTTLLTYWDAIVAL